MPIPFQQIMLPLLKELKNGEEKSTADIRTKLQNHFKLSEEEAKKLLPSGGNRSIFSNRVNWAKTYLKKAGLIDYPQRSYARITKTGKEVLNENLSEITFDYLKKFPEFLEFLNLNSKKEQQEELSSNETPLEQLDMAYTMLKDELKKELLENVRKSSYFFFEQIIVDLLINLGYGGSKKEAGKAFKTTKDEGIDGVIKEDKLGLDLIYTQAKKWEACIGRPEIQKFAGALQGKKAKKGIFVTTSYFSNDAIEYVKTIDSKIILIDGDSLVEYMIDTNTGVNTTSKYEVKKIDEDYFSDNI